MSGIYMTEIIIDDRTPRKQHVSLAGQKIFTYDFPIRTGTDLKVYQRASSSLPIDSTDILEYLIDYTVTGAGSESGGTFILTTGATVGYIVTAVRDIPIARTSDLQISFTHTDINYDFDNGIMMLQQNEMMFRDRALLYPNSAVIESKDKILPILGAKQLFAKNAANTAIIATSFSDVYSDLQTRLASHAVGDGASMIGMQTPRSDTVQDILGHLADIADGTTKGFVIRTALGVYTTRTLTGATNQISITNPEGETANPIISIADNPIMSGYEAMTVPRGTTLQRPVTPVAGMVRHDLTLGKTQIYETGSWQTIITDATGAPRDAKYIVQQPHDSLINEQALSELTSGILKSATTTGIISIAINGTDYISSVYADHAPSLYANLNAQNKKIINLAAPVDNLDATNKIYVDTKIEEENLWNRFLTPSPYLLPNDSTDTLGDSTHALTKGWFTNFNITNIPTINGLPINTSHVVESGNLYYTDVRARTSISCTATGLTYTSGTGVLSLTANYVIPTTTEETNWNDAYSKRVDTWNLPLSLAANVASIAASTYTTLGAASFSATDFTVTAGAVELKAGGTGLYWDRFTTYLLPHTATDELGDTSHRLQKGWFTNLEITNAYSLNGVAQQDISTTSTPAFAQVNVDNLRLDGNTLSSISGNINVTPFAGSAFIIDGHWSFDGTTMTAITDNNTTLTAYTGKNISIEGVTFDGGVVAGIVTATWGATVISETDIAKIDGITNGTAAANKALVTDGSIDIGTIRNLTATGTIQGEQLTSTDDITATDLITGARFNATNTSGLAIQVNVAAASVVSIGRHDGNSLNFEYGYGTTISSTANLSILIDSGDASTTRYVEVRKNSTRGGTGGAQVIKISEDGSVVCTGAFSGITTLSMSGQLTSTLAIGTSPFAVTSTTVNTNLNADLLDGYHSSSFEPTLTKNALTASSPLSLSAAVTVIGAGAALSVSASTYTDLGAASFSATDFTVTAGAVELKAGGTGLYWDRFTTYLMPHTATDTIGATADRIANIYSLNAHISTLYTVGIQAEADADFQFSAYGLRNIKYYTTGGTFTLYNDVATNPTYFIIDNHSGTKKYTGIKLYRNGTESWFYGMDETDDDFYIQRNYTGFPPASDIPFEISNSTGVTTINKGLSIASGSYLQVPKAEVMRIVGATYTKFLASTEDGAAYTYTIPAAGADCSFVMTAGTQTIGGAKTFSSAITTEGIYSNAASGDAYLYLQTIGVNKFLLGRTGAGYTYLQSKLGTNAIILYESDGHASCPSRLTVYGSYTSSITTSAAGLDDLSWGGSYIGSTYTTRYFVIQIDYEGLPDTFKWSKDNGATWEATGVAITGAVQTLRDGVTITFSATTGHTFGDKWFQQITTVNEPFNVYDAGSNKMISALNSTGFIWNEDYVNVTGVDRDFDIRGIDSAKRLFFDASSGYAGLGIATPDKLLHLYTAGDTFAKIDCGAASRAAELQLHRGGSLDTYIGVNAGNEACIYSTENIPFRITLNSNTVFYISALGDAYLNSPANDPILRFSTGGTSTKFLMAYSIAGAYQYMQSAATGYVDSVRIYDSDGRTYLSSCGIAYASALDANYILQLPNDSSKKAKAYAWDTYSSIEMKESIRSINHPLKILNKIDAAKYKWKYMHGDEGKEWHYGFIAEYLNESFPDASNGDSINILPIVAILVESVKEMAKNISDLEKRIEILESL